MGQQAAIQRQIDLLRVGPPPTPPQLSPSQQSQSAGIQQNQSDRKLLKRQYRTSKRAANVAAHMIQSGLGSAVAELQAQGLQGPELQSAIREFAARQADAVAAASYHKNAATADFVKADRPLAQDIQKGKIERNAAISQANTQYQQDLQTYGNKLTIAGLEAQKRAASGSSGAAGGLTPTQRRAQAESRASALIGVKGILQQNAPDSKGVTPRDTLRQSRASFITLAASKIPQAEPGDVAWALAQLEGKIRAARSGNTKALGKIRTAGLGGKTSQAILGG